MRNPNSCKVAYKLKKADIEMLEKAGLALRTFQKGDYVSCHYNFKKKELMLELFPDEEHHCFCVHSYKPLEKDQIAFSFLGEKYYELENSGKDVWNEFSKKVIKAEALSVLDRVNANIKRELSPKFYCDRKVYPFDNITDEMFLPKNVNIDVYLASAADLAVYGKLAEEVEELSFKLDKHSKKLTRVFDEIYKVERDNKEEEKEEDIDLD